MAFEAAIFDFDGTLVDTSGGVMGGVSYALGELYGERHTLESLRDYMGPPLSKSFARHGYPEQDRERFLRLYTEFYDREGIYTCRLYPGVERGLGLLRQRGVRLAVASSKSRPSIISTFRQCGGDCGIFEVIAGAADSGDNTGKAACIARVLEALGISDPERAVMVGDRYLDAEGAAGNALPFAAALYGGFGPREEFQPWRVDCWGESFEEIVEFILG